MIMIKSQEQKRQQQHIRVFFYCLHQNIFIRFFQEYKKFCYYQKDPHHFMIVIIKNIFLLGFSTFVSHARIF